MADDNKPRTDLTPEHIEALFVLTVEDLTKGGVDARRALAAMILAWARLVESQIGRERTVNVLRKIASRYECPHQSSQPAARLN